MYPVVKVTGNTIELYVYSKAPTCARRKVRSIKRYSEFKRPRSLRSIFRARDVFRDLLISNSGSAPTPGLFSLTFKEAVTWKQGWRAYTLFIQRLRNRGYVGRVAAVAEAQKRGTIHFHGLLFDEAEFLTPCLMSRQFYRDRTGKLHRRHVCPDHRQCERKTRVLADIWGYGYCDLMKTDGSPRLAIYLAKYFLKGAFLLPESSKFFSASRNCKRPTKLSGRDVNNVLWSIPVDKRLAPSQVREYDTKYLGRCVYKRYDI